jgi:hypothetical protein
MYLALNTDQPRTRFNQIQIVIQLVPHSSSPGCKKKKKLYTTLSFLTKFENDSIYYKRGIKTTLQIS